MPRYKQQQQTTNNPKDKTEYNNLLVIVRRLKQNRCKPPIEKLTALRRQSARQSVTAQERTTPSTQYPVPR
jgi:hypothetical protein